MMGQMKNTITLALILLAACDISFRDTSQTLFVNGLQIEYLTNPLGIDTETPRFSWRLFDKNNTRGQKQTAYQVLVASEKSLLNTDQADIWNSSRVSGNQSALVPFEGKKLISGHKYYWKVRVWDKNKKPSSWSAVSHFSMGLLEQDDWKGSWIMHPYAAAEKHIWYRKNLKLEQKPRFAYLHLASLGYHELYVNGKKVDDSVLAPTLTRLDKRVHYVTYDVSGMLSEGTNTVAVWYGPGWSRYDAGPIEDIFGVPQAIKVQLSAKTPEGKDISLVSDSTWRCRISSSENTGPWRSGGQGDMGGEKIDARMYIPDWNAVDFDDHQWQFAKETNADPVLSAQMMEPTRIIETIHAQEITGDKTWRVDMGKNFTGFIEISMTGQSYGDTVTIMTANQPGVVQDFGQKSLYVCSGDDRETFTNRFNYMAGRYITIEGLKRRPGLSDITGYAISTDLEQTSRFFSSSELFNQIYEIDLWSYRNNTTEGFTADCPHRERLGYGEHAFTNAWGCGLPSYRSGAYLTKHVRDWADVQEENGWINHTAPQINRHFGGPMWSSGGLNVAWEYYQTYGDKQILELTYDAGKRWVEFLYTKMSDGLLQPYFSSWGRFLGDWAAPNNRSEGGDIPEAVFFNNCVYAMNLRTLIEIANILGMSDDAALFGLRLEEVKQRIHEHFFDTEKQVYLNGRQVELAFPLMTGLTPEHLRPVVFSNFEKEITQTRPYLDAGSSGLPILLKYLIEDVERSDILFEHLSKKNYPSYGYFISRGETTWPEHWHVDVPSRIHTCYTGISAWFIKSLGGIRPDPEKPGYQEFLIKPQIVGDLTHVEAATESLYGLIESRWHREGESLRLNVTIPANSSATVYMPSKDAGTLLENGRPIRQTKGVEIINTEDNYVVLKVESGKYELYSPSAL